MLVIGSTVPILIVLALVVAISNTSAHISYNYNFVSSSGTDFIVLNKWTENKLNEPKTG